MTVSADPRPQGRSSFTAAFLSFIFPGLGHAYAGATVRALGFAAAPLLAVSLVAGIVVRFRPEILLAGAAEFLPALLVLNVVVLLYRVAAVVDAYRVTAYLNGGAPSGRGLGLARLHLHPFSMAGLVAVIVVAAGFHAGVAYYGLQSLDLISNVFGQQGDSAIQVSSPPGSGSADASGAPATSGTAPSAPSAAATPAPWNESERLNILLIGADQRPNEGTFNTDTLIVVSVDPTTKQVAMFSLPRDTVDVPLPPIAARSVYGPTYGGKINSMWTAARARPDLFPGGGFVALKQSLGYLYNLNIQYYVEVNFDGFRKVVDTLGGVTINVQTPVMDDDYPGDNGLPQRIYIPAGIQHMTGAQALIYARSRHASNDFDRAARQQRVLLSLRQQTDVQSLLNPGTFGALVQALKSAIHTDIPLDKLPSLMALAGKINSQSIHSFVFAYPLYEQQVLNDPKGRGYVLEPYVDKIRATVAAAFQFDPKQEARREAIATENASVWVLNGSGIKGQAGRIAAFLENQGVAAVAPNKRVGGPAPAATRIQVYNGAESKLPATLAYLQSIFGVQATPVTDPTVTVDIIVTTAPTTPNPTASPVQ